MAKARPLCPRCETPVTGGSMDCPDVMIQGQPVADPDSVTVTYDPVAARRARPIPTSGSSSISSSGSSVFHEGRSDE